MEYTDRIVDAFALAFDLHRTQKRKGSETPYLTHLMATASIVGEFGGDEDQFIAALLHDAVEDQGGRKTLDLVRARFGDRVADFVDGCSDSDAQPRPPWRERKERHLVKAATAAPELRLLIAADKLHNARTMLTDLREQGNDIWKRFRGNREGTLWYYAEMVRALATNWTHPVLRELAQVVDMIQRTDAELERFA